ncbi:MAG: glycosyltransferase [Proteobacteria bacterium]|nr:glycosyltransferase [Pseudomonadota bacterium]
MRVGVLTTSYPRHADDWAGGFVAELARWLAREGDALEVLAPTPASDSTPGVRVRPLRYARTPRLCYGAGAPDNLLGAGDWGGRAAAWAQLPAFVGRLAAASWWHARRWDAVVSHWLLPAGLVGARLARGRPHLAIAHSSDVHLLRRLPQARWLLRALARPRSALVLTSAALRPPLLAVARDATSRRWVERAPVVPMGVAPPAWLEAERALGRPRAVGAPLRVLYIGRLIALKGVDLLLQACAGLPCALTVVGDGPERSALEALAARHAVAVDFVGQQAVPSKWRALLAADVVGAALAGAAGRADRFGAGHVDRGPAGRGAGGRRGGRGCRRAARSGGVRAVGAARAAAGTACGAAALARRCGARRAAGRRRSSAGGGLRVGSRGCAAPGAARRALGPKQARRAHVWGLDFVRGFQLPQRRRRGLAASPQVRRTTSCAPRERFVALACRGSGP